MGAAEPREPLTWDQISEVREDVLAAGARLAEQLGPTPERRRSVLAMTDTPRALTTDLGSALEEDAGSQRRIAALWLLVAILDGVPEGGLAEAAEPILLFDDIEANLHPTWLAALAAVAFNLPFQQIVATHSPEVLAWVPLSSLRRLSRGPDGIDHVVGPDPALLDRRAAPAHLPRAAQPWRLVLRPLLGAGRG